MGQYNTKEEEKIIMQSGSNVQIDELKLKVEMYAAIILPCLVCGTIFIFCLCCNKCRKGIRRSVSERLDDLIKTRIPPTTTARTEGLQTAPSRVVFS